MATLIAESSYRILCAWKISAKPTQLKEIDSRPEAVQQWLLELRSLCAGEKIAIALEQRRGPLFYQLCSHLNWIDLFPVNPQSLTSFRQTFFSSRAKDDPVDSQLLEELVRTHGDRLRPYQPQSISERKLDSTAAIVAICWIWQPRPN
jgi:transposase